MNSERKSEQVKFFRTFGIVLGIACVASVAIQAGYKVVDRLMA